MENNIIIRALTAADDEIIATVIRQASHDFGLTAEKGYGVSDLVSQPLSSLYQHNMSNYWVVELNGEIIGGAGIAPIENRKNIRTCELQKMYFLNKARGLGIGKKLCQFCLEQAKKLGYQLCYLETTAVLAQAYHLYKSIGFEDIHYRLGNSGHDDCEIMMIKRL
ncbi:GNAT family N-acetyltransferase [Shewanella sp. 202IG2-18]|uniref:GNAT family N-acetyltransferase n=1 Tax=Parashewanella hymeniacidonis TaxID=2807618 RepID=UPI0019607336|nr:GNAT family N-acetyltransferase [Parashewanella hymeniacidonis]MBM7072319.1 GNAT family N-acetyltransferase [Parashewanella hymeniacidonis]